MSLAVLTQPPPPLDLYSSSDHYFRFTSPTHMSSMDRNTPSSSSNSLTPTLPSAEPPSTLKRKRDSRTVTDGSFVKSRDPPKKKKAARACMACQRAHLTCSDSRPCERCVRRGIADQCVEGHRKKAKYLLDEDELESLKLNKDKDKSTSKAPASSQNAQNPPTSFGQGFSYGYETNKPGFGNPSSSEFNMIQPVRQEDPTSAIPYPADTSYFHNPPTGWNIPGSHAESNFGPNPGSFSAATQDPYSSSFAGPQETGQSQFSTPQPTGYFPSSLTQQGFPTNPIGESDAPPPLSSTQDQSTSRMSMQTSLVRPSDVYESVQAPYDYSHGYDYLVQYVQSRFEKNDVLRVVRALAVFRPSLIALQMPLSVEDEIFVEKSLQRSLLELEKLITYSGTPTAVWRRTGEICLVGLEFCMLTEWSHQELLGQNKFIYELFETQSVIEYWEKFAKHSFENANQSIYAHSILMKPSGEPVPCSFCFTIRRDIFDLPSLIIGQWLPIL